MYDILQHDLYRYATKKKKKQFLKVVALDMSTCELCDIMVVLIFQK